MAHKRSGAVRLGRGARMNNFSFWLLPPAAILLSGSFFAPGGAEAAGWTMYAPLSIQMGPVWT